MTGVRTRTVEVRRGSITAYIVGVFTRLNSRVNNKFKSYLRSEYILKGQIFKFQPNVLVIVNGSLCLCMKWDYYKHVITDVC